MLLRLLLSKITQRVKDYKGVLVVWDECTMAHEKCIEAVDNTLRDIRQNNLVVGGITVLFSGDFRQTLPVVTKGTRAD